jgi:PAS domain S-box-containing protein
MSSGRFPQIPEASNEASHFRPEWCHVALASIGEAVITTDAEGRVTSLNSVAESLTGWTMAEAASQPLDRVSRVIDEQSRHPVENPILRASRGGFGLANHSLLVARDGTERPIDHSVAPIRNERGEVAGFVLVFRDVGERRRQEHQHRDALRSLGPVVWYCDPSGTTERAELRAGDLKVIEGDNDVKAGIMASISRIQTGRLRVSRVNCPDLIAEARLYRYPSAAEKAAHGENPIDENNHALGALR